MRKAVKTITNTTLDFLLPPLCPATGEPVDAHGMVDATYWQQLSFINAPLCDRCGTPFAFQASSLECGACLDHPPVFNQNRSALTYDDASRHLILRFKHGDQTHAVRAFIPWLRLAGHGLLSEADIILPVPLHPFRLIKRRYNQAELIARELVKHYPQTAYQYDGLYRIRPTLSQGHKNAKDRQRNVSRAFQANPRYSFENKTILMIDDVFTTGATLNECAKTLYRAGAKEVNCLTLAKVVKS